MRKYFFFIFFLYGVAPLSVQASLSALRYEEESYQNARLRSIAQSPRIYSDSIDESSQTAHDVAKKLSEVDLSNVPLVETLDQVTEYYEYVRNTPFIETKDAYLEARRITWFYPDDGCYIRAMMMAIFLDHDKSLKLDKIFAFGNLRAETEYSRSGIVRWWYHVAVAVRYGSEVYVFDPAVNHNKALTVQEWRDSIADKDDEVKFSICSSKTYGPDSDCYNPKDYQDAFYIKVQKKIF